LPPREGRARRLDRSSLTAAAAELIDRDGVESLSLATLAQAVGVKPPSLYAHITGLQDLKTELAILGLVELEAELARAAIGQAGAAAVRSLCQAYRVYALRRPGVYLATVLWTPHDSDKVRTAGDALKATALQILFPKGKDRSAEEQIHVLRLLRVALHGFVALEMADAFGEPVDPEETFARLVNQLVALVSEASSGL
jgi:AcrR family transcriptional regulator